MTNLTIAPSDSELGGSCALCGKWVAPAAGPRLVEASTREPVCRDCGRRNAPPLAALLDLGLVARRVGRIGRHTLVPPMNALLELARAAEHYHDSGPRVCRQAA